MSGAIYDYDRATAGLAEVPNDWMPATGLRAIVEEDPCQLWLHFHGKNHGLKPDDPDYSFLAFIGAKGQEFEAKWVSEMAPEAVRVCNQAFEVRHASAFATTCRLMQERVPVIYQGALWWAPERIYGTPDLIVLRSWLQDKFPSLFPLNFESDHYVVLDCKFSTGYDMPEKAKDLAIASAQVRIYSYIIGQLQGRVPDHAYLITRDRMLDPLSVEIESTLDAALDMDLAECRDVYLDIKLNCRDCTP